MEHSNSDACLPPGWTVKVKVRKNGHKDKFYFPPSSDRKFNSMVGVLRYLDKAKNKASLQSISNNSEDVTMKPTLSASSGQILRNQQIPRRASKRLAGIKADPLQDLKRTRAHRHVVKKPREGETVKISEKSANSLLNDQDKQFNELNRPETVINADASLPPGWTVEVKVRKNGHKDKFYFTPSSDLKFDSLVGVLRYLDKAKNKASLQSISNNSEDVTMKPTLPESSSQIPRDQQILRRASKRLAGIKADPPQDLKRTRARQDVVKQPREDETVIIADKSANSFPSDQDKQFNALDRPEPVINIDASLPPGWTVKVNVRKNGHKDKYYFPPSSEKKFNSMVAVLRYLDKAKNKASLQSTSDNSEDVTMKPTFSAGSGQIPRDQQIPRRASKRLAGIKAYPPQERKRTRARRDVVKQPREDETVIIADKSTNSLPNDQAKQFNTLNRPETVVNADASLPPGWTVNVKVRKNGHKDKYYFPPSSEKKFNSMVGVLRYLDKAKNKASLQSISNNSENATMKPTLSVSLGQNSGLDMISSGKQIPRRSKRLAGIKADQLKTTRASGDVVKQTGEDKSTINADRSTNKLPNDQVKLFNALDGSETKFNNKSTENTMENNPTEKDSLRVLENGDNVVAKLDYRCECDSPLQVILTDPCFAFAVQTLSGETFETSNDTQISSEPKSIQTCETSTEKHGMKINITCDDSDRRNMLSSPKSFAIQGKHVDIALIDNAHKNAGPSEKKLDISKMAVSTVNLCKRLQLQPAVW